MSRMSAILFLGFHLLFVHGTFAKEKPYCAKPKSDALSPVIEIVDLAKRNQPAANVSKEAVVERDLLVDGVAVIDGKTRISLKVRIPGSTEIIGKILLSPGQSYRGVEALDTSEGEVTMLSREGPEGKRIPIRIGGSKWVKVLVLAEARDEEGAFFSAAKGLNFSKYEELINQDRGGTGKFLKGEFELNRERFLKYSRGTHEDNRGILVTTQVAAQCAIDGDWKSVALKMIEKDKRNGGFLLRPSVSCALPDGTTGICCQDKCVAKQDQLKVDANNSCRVIDDCGDSSSESNRLLNGTPCDLPNHKEGGPQPICRGGNCIECVNPSDSCKEEVGTMEEGKCQFSPLPEGRICAEGKICKQGQCVSFNTSIQLADFKTNPILRSYIAQSISPDKNSAPVDIDALVDLALAKDESAELCQRITTPNGSNCPLPNVTGMRRWEGRCFDGLCRVCEPKSDEKLKGAPPCPPSLRYPDKKGTRVSCREPDLCEYR